MSQSLNNIPCTICIGFQNIIQKCLEHEIKNSKNNENICIINISIMKTYNILKASVILCAIKHLRFIA